MSRYVLKGTKNRGEVVGKIRLDDDRVLVLDGEAVEMSDKEHDNLINQGYTLHKRPDRASDKNDDEVQKSDITEDNNTSEGGDK